MKQLALDLNVKTISEGKIHSYLTAGFFLFSFDIFTSDQRVFSIFNY